LHNLKGYDSHFIVPALNKYGYKQDRADNISCIPSNEEKYISFSKKIKVSSYINKKTKKEQPIFFELKFIDTIAFMNSTLDKLVENVKNGCKTIEEQRQAFKYRSHQFPNDEKFISMIKKGIYPYEYITSYDKLLETELPTIDKFYSTLSLKGCSNSDYEIAKNVWRLHDCKNILDYHNVYLMADELLLADVFENFKTTCYNIYGLDASYYYTAPGLSWDAFLKHTNEEYRLKYNKDFEIDLITEDIQDIYLLFEESIRGGLSQISKRYAKANNKYLKSYNKNIEESHILYLDANNLYGYAMCCFLP
jgi:hypothetical protein